MSVTFGGKFTAIFRRLGTALMPAFLLTGFSTAQSSSIFNNIASLCSPYSKTQPGCGYYPVFGPKGDFAVPLSDYAAAQFTPQASGLATDAKITVVQTAPGPGFPSSGSLTLAIFSDAVGLPGTQIGQTGPSVSAPYCCNAATVTATFKEPVSLSAGVPYWLVVEPGASSTYVAWVVGGDKPVPVAQTLSSPNAKQCGWCAYGPSALQFAIGTGTTAGSLLVVDPYLLSIPQSDLLSVGTVVSGAASGKANAKGIMADGSSAAIAVYKTTSSKSVTFTATNGARVAAYSEDFLTNTSDRGSGSVEVTPTEIDGEYYALALVIGGTPPAAEIGARTEITAASTGLADSASYSLLTLPTPVVFIHGLWGNSGSLASTLSYFKSSAATFQLNPYLLTPICYSVYLGFDAASDTIPGHGAGCERTSAQALDSYFSSTLAPQLNADHFVGGRVDAVVHSMGGLVARHYSATKNFKSVRNRNLGAFRNVITLDTPETGSALATYLDGAYNRTRQVTEGTPNTLWRILCGKLKTITLESCFYGAGMPLAYKGMALSTGAVASLIPGGPSLASTPAPAVFDTGFGKWFAIASNFKDGDQPASLLRDLLDNLVAATYANGQTAPTLSSILGTKNSDVIVTVASQTSSAPAAQVRQFKDLEHTPAPAAGILLFPLDNNNSVTDWPAVNQQAAYWLGLVETAPAELEDSGSGPGAESEFEPAGEESATPFVADDRLSIQAPGQPAGLGQPVEITLRHPGGPPMRIAVEQTSAATSAELKNRSQGAEVGSSRAKIVGEFGGLTTIEVVPLRTGAVNLAISAGFADGGLATQQLRLNVVPSAKGARRFDLNGGFHVLALALGDDSEASQASLFPAVYYDSLEYPVRLESTEALTLTVDQPENDPVVRVDSGGLVHAVRPGRAVIHADFDGMKDSVTVDVSAKDGAQR